MADWLFDARFARALRSEDGASSGRPRGRARDRNDDRRWAPHLLLPAPSPVIGDGAEGRPRVERSIWGCSKLELPTATTGGVKCGAGADVRVLKKKRAI